MKIKTFDHVSDEPYTEFDKRINDFVKNKQVIQIKVNETANKDFILSHSLTILYKDKNIEDEEDDK